MSENASARGVISLSLLQLALIILKFCGVLKWSWWAVFIPLFLDTFFAIGLFVYLIIKIKRRARQEDNINE